MEDQRIAIITPMKNEMDNLARLLESIESQCVKIYIWIVIDDNSSDGGGEYLLKYAPSLKNVEHFFVIRNESLHSSYMLGKKYSAVVSFGFLELSRIQSEIGIIPDFVGILDADCFLDKNYYLNLLRKFELIPKLGIASGKLYSFVGGQKVFHRYPDRWAIGGVRLWRYNCFIESGYITGYSADALSTAKAWMMGWSVQSFRDSLVESRPVGGKVNSEYYGVSAYYRHIPLYFVLLRVLFYSLIGKRAQLDGYLKGYLKARNEKHEQLQDQDIKMYFKYVILRGLVESLVVLRNKFRISVKKDSFDRVSN